VEALVSWQERAGVTAAGAGRRYWVTQCSAGSWRATVGWRPWRPAKDIAHLRLRQVPVAFGPLGSSKMRQLREQAASFVNMNHQEKFVPKYNAQIAWPVIGPLIIKKY